MDTQSAFLMAAKTLLQNLGQINHGLISTGGPSYIQFQQASMIVNSWKLLVKNHLPERPEGEQELKQRLNETKNFLMAEISKKRTAIPFYRKHGIVIPILSETCE